MRGLRLWLYGGVFLLFIILVGVNLSEVFQITTNTVSHRSLIVDNEQHTLALRISLFILLLIICGIISLIITIFHRRHK